VYTDCGALEGRCGLSSGMIAGLVWYAFWPGNCDALKCAVRPRRHNREVNHLARIAARGEPALGDE
jgi:hypothetical protein